MGTGARGTIGNKQVLVHRGKKSPIAVVNFTFLSTEFSKKSMEGFPSCVVPAIACSGRIFHFADEFGIRNSENTYRSLYGTGSATTFFVGVYSTTHQHFCDHDYPSTRTRQADSRD